MLNVAPASTKEPLRCLGTRPHVSVRGDWRGKVSPAFLCHQGGLGEGGDSNDFVCTWHSGCRDPSPFPAHGSKTPNQPLPSGSTLNPPPAESGGRAPCRAVTHGHRLWGPWGQVARAGGCRGWAKGRLPSPRRARPWHQARSVFLSVLSEAIGCFFPQPSPVPPWLRGDSNSNTPAAVTT